MMDFFKTRLVKTIVHKVGNKSLEEGYQLSENVFDAEANPDLNDVLLNYFTGSFKETIFYRFDHPVDPQLNDVYRIVNEVFADVDGFVDGSKSIAKLLYDSSMHPRIKAGEVYIAYLADCVVDNKTVDAIGIFKSENKDTFLTIEHGKSRCSIDFWSGVNTSKLDKGALIVKMKDQEEPYWITTIDNLNQIEAQYWKDDFLRLKPLQDSYHATNNFLSATREFVNQLDDEFDVSQADKIDLLNKSIKYFKSHDNFKQEEFEGNVLGDVQLISSFRQFNGNFQEFNEVQLEDDFTISANAVRMKARVFKSVLKLDKNFHVYIHGNRSMIEKGTDEDGRKYYKLYYDEEN